MFEPIYPGKANAKMSIVLLILESSVIYSLSR